MSWQSEGRNQRMEGWETDDSRGVTLIELSIVLVIVGLVVAGIIGGQSLVRSVKLKSIMTDINEMRTALNTFEDYYSYLPGDLPNAQQYWPAPTCVDDPGDTSNKCNGDGNSQLEGTYSDECLRAFQHLSLAEMIQGNYAGVVSSPYRQEAGFNVPEISFKGGGLIIRDSRDGTPVSGRHGIYFQIAGLVTQAGFGQGGYAEGLFTPSDAELIDRKMDDGQPQTGRVWGRDGDNTSDCLDGSDYYLSQTGQECKLNYWILW